MARTKILLADDQDRVRRLVAATLGSAQWELLYASDGEEAPRIAACDRAARRNHAEARRL
jgi:DNA-binding response OmpR family regulator